MPLAPLKSILIMASIFLVLMATLLPARTAMTADVPSGLYIKDDRDYNEIGLVCRMDLQETAKGLWQVRITAANPALCGGVLEGEARLENGIVVFRDGSCPDPSDSEDCCVLELDFSQDAVSVSGPPCLAEQCPLAGTYFRYGALVKPVDQIIKDIRAHYYRTNKIIDELDLDQREIPGSSDQPQGLLKVYSDMGFPKKIVVDLKGDKTRVVEEYYYFDHVLLFCFRLTIPNDPQGSSGPPREDRFYFHQDRMIRWLDHAKKEVPSTDAAFPAEQQKILSSSARYLALAE